MNTKNNKDYEKIVQIIKHAYKSEKDIAIKKSLKKLLKEIE